MSDGFDDWMSDWPPAKSAAANRFWERQAPFLPRHRVGELREAYGRFCTYLDREGLSLARAWQAGLLDMRRPEAERRLMAKQLKERKKRRAHAAE